MFQLGTRDQRDKGRQGHRHLEQTQLQEQPALRQAQARGGQSRAAAMERCRSTAVRRPRVSTCKPLRNCACTPCTPRHRPGQPPVRGRGPSRRRQISRSGARSWGRSAKPDRPEPERQTVARPGTSLPARHWPRRTASTYQQGTRCTHSPGTCRASRLLNNTVTRGARSSSVRARCRQAAKQQVSAIQHQQQVV